HRSTSSGHEKGRRSGAPIDGPAVATGPGPAGVSSVLCGLAAGHDDRARAGTREEQTTEREGARVRAGGAAVRLDDPRDLGLGAARVVAGGVIGRRLLGVVTGAIVLSRRLLLGGRLLLGRGFDVTDRDGADLGVLGGGALDLEDEPVLVLQLRGEVAGGDRDVDVLLRR